MIGVGGIDQTFLDLLGLVYDAAADRRLWPLVMERMAGLFSGHSVLFFQDMKRPDAAVFETARIGGDFVKSYLAHYAATNVWTPRVAALPPGAVVQGDDLLPREAFEASEFYNDWLRPQGLAYGIGAILGYEDTVLTTFSVMRSPAAGPYTEDEIAILRLLAPHFRRAFQLHHELASARLRGDLGLEGLDQLSTAAIVVDALARPMVTNRSADALLAAGDGISLMAGCLAGRSSRATDAMQALIRRSVETAAGRGVAPGGYVSLPRRERRPLTALIVPVRPARERAGPQAPAAVVFIRDPDASTPVAEDGLRALFGLTAAEAKLAAALVAGQTIEGFAEANAVSVHTARTHLRNAMTKTFTKRQSEFVALILRSVASLTGG